MFKSQFSPIEKSIDIANVDGKSHKKLTTRLGGQLHGFHAVVLSHMANHLMNGQLLITLVGSSNTFALPGLERATDVYVMGHYPLVSFLLTAIVWATHLERHVAQRLDRGIKGDESLTEIRFAN